MEKRSSFQNLMGEFLTITVVSVIASGFFQILVPNSFTLTFGVFWALGTAGWLYVMVRRSPALQSAVSDIRKTIHPAKSQKIAVQRCRYCRQRILDIGRCPNCGAIN